tara:strand:- start:114 stop:581 length:468 start_codon:yes stop_codon:yes gene_type:complete
MKKVNQSSFKKALSKYATGITITSINNNGTFIGKTVNSFSSLSLKPPLVLFSLDKKSSSLKQFKKSKNIGISFLSNKQIEISKNFAKKSSNWNSTEYFLANNNIPLIKNCVANLACINIKNFSFGDHIIFICKVEKIKINAIKKPLIYLKNKYIK